MHSHQPQLQSILSRSLPPTPSQLHAAVLDESDDVPDDYFNELDDVPLPFPIQTIVADPHTGLSLTLISALGAGSYAVVYLAREVASGTLYALKCLGKDKLTEEEVAVQRNEVVIHTSLPKHKNIIHLFNMFETTHHLFLLLEYSSGMDMYQWISMCSDKSDPITGEPHTFITRYTVIKSIFDQVLEGVGQVHSCGVAHRDLKPENFLIECVDGQYIVKLTDFGLATTDSESDEFECGSKPYMSFECRNGIDATYNVQMADIWSLGIILINLLYRRCPWSDPCPQESYNFTEFLKSRVDFLQRRFEDMPGPVARWLGLRAFEFVGPSKLKRRRSRPSIDEWKTWMIDFVPRMLGQISSEVEDEYDDQEEYREYLKQYEGDTIGQEVEGDEILDGKDEGDDTGNENQVVPIAIQSSSFKSNQHLNPETGRYASRHTPTDARVQNSFHSSIPKFDPSAFYQPTRLRQESWSDVMDMEGTEDAEMDFSAPILFEESEEDEANNQRTDNDIDSAGLAVAFPDDFIDPLPDISASSSGRQTPSTPTMPKMTFNSEKRQLPAHLRFDFDSTGHNSMQESSKRNTGRSSPGAELNDQINTLVFIEPDISRAVVDPNQSSVIGGGHVIASSLPSTSHMETSLNPSKERVLLKQQMRKPARNLQDVKATPFVFPPLKTAATPGNLTMENAHSLVMSPQAKDKPGMLPEKVTSKDLVSKEVSKTPLGKSGVYVIPNRSQVSSWASSSTGTSSSRPAEAASGGRVPNWKRSHNRGGSWASIDDTLDSHRDTGARRHGDGAKTGSGKWRTRLEDKEDGHVGLPPRVENKFRPRYRQGRRFPQSSNASALPPIPPQLNHGSGIPRSRHQSRSGIAFDSNALVSSSEIERKPGAKEATTKESSYHHQQQEQLHNQPPSQSKYENSQLRLHGKVTQGNPNSRLAGQRNKSLMDLRAAAASDAINQPWRQPTPSATKDLSPTTNTMIKTQSQTGKSGSGPRKGFQGAYALDQGSSGTSSSKSRLADRQTPIDVDNVYHPPHWHERNNSSSSSSSHYRPSNGNESDSQKADGAVPSGSHSHSRSFSKGRSIGHHAGSNISPPSDRKHGPQRQTDLANSWRGIEFSRGQDRPLNASKKPTIDPSGSFHSANASLVSIKSDDSQGPLLMTLTPPTPSLNVKSEFLSDTSKMALNPEELEQENRAEPKKIVKPSAMTGLGNMLRGLVAYNKSIKVGGEGVNASEQNSRPIPE
ncbi:hypothetical protein BGX21_009246 [Mortierella sp. AD011]|nr:hypothetical protein BGX20_009808 [Mortierella sp. AD010]KAF9402673.1 hypothetical protein BGX21_009246 [Mortierella sp. AD011]